MSSQMNTPGGGSTALLNTPHPQAVFFCSPTQGSAGFSEIWQDHRSRDPPGISHGSSVYGLEKDGLFETEWFQKRNNLIDPRHKCIPHSEQ